MSERAPYSRVYWSVMDDEKFDGVRDDARLMGSWLLLLIQADMAHPAPAHLPRTVSMSSVKALTEAGLVDTLTGHRYRIHGLDAERERRKDAATTRGPNGPRTVPKRDPNADQAKQSRAEHRQAEQSARADDPADAYWQLTGKYPTDKTLGWIDDLTSRFGHDAVNRALVGAHTADRSTSTLLGRAQDILRAEARELDRREREDEQQRLREKRAVPREEEPWKVAYRAALVERYGEDAA